MSANRWVRCPKCKAAQAERIAKVRAQLEQSYGRVSRQEFDKLQADLTAAEKELPTSFGEYYDVYGAEDGEIVVDYGAHCNDCQLTVSFKHAVPITGVRQ